MTGRISALFDGGLTADQIAEDFPSLTKLQIAESIAYAQTVPAIFGNSYPTQSLKRLLRNSGFKKVEKELRKAKKR
jgi:hypothetical protein